MRKGNALVIQHDNVVNSSPAQLIKMAKEMSDASLNRSCALCVTVTSYNSHFSATADHQRQTLRVYWLVDGFPSMKHARAVAGVKIIFLF